MPDSVALTRICDLLIERYGDLGQAAGKRLRHWLSGAVPYADPEIINQHLHPEHVDLLFDAFWQVLPFGTGGRRGRVGYGANRINPAIVAMTVQGQCHYLLKTFPHAKNPTVVVANDVRVFRDIAGTYSFLGQDHPLLEMSSRSLGKLACEIYASNGIIAYFMEPESDLAVMTTPELSYLIDRLGAVGGINFSASHNPPDDNGIKVYDQFGSQPIAPSDQHLVDTIAQAGEPHRMPFAQALAAGLIRDVPKQLREDYIVTYIKLYDNIHTPDPNLPITYTPLCGCGLTTVGAVLERLGFPLLVPPEQGPDGSFSVIPFKAPNPEVPQATEPARVIADAKGSKIILSSDPDGDRVGLDIKLADGTYYHFDGNQIAAILCYFLMLDRRGPQRKGLVIETLVTTKLLSAIVEKAGNSWLIDDLLVGFKYIADVLKTLQAGQAYGNVFCSPEQLVLAAEESHGVLMVSTIRDKDAVPACMYLAALHQILQREGRTLLDYYLQILEELGAYDCVNRSIMMAGPQGMQHKNHVMASLRQSPPETLGDHAVRKVVDYWDEDSFGPFVSDTDKLPRNVVQIFTDALVITVRPSGTEPKLKLYCQLLPYGEATTTKGMALLREVREKTNAAARKVYNELLQPINLHLSEAALRLPDIIDLDQKQHFDQKTIPHLQDRLATDAFATLDELLAWLQKEVATMTPGTNPLPALKAPMAYLCACWTPTPLLKQLENWAKT